MFRALVIAVLCAAVILPLEAQMRGGAARGVGSGFRTGGIVVGGGPTIVPTWGMRNVRAFPGRFPRQFPTFFNGFNSPTFCRFGRCFNPAFFPGNNRFGGFFGLGFGSVPFGAFGPWAWGTGAGYYGSGYYGGYYGTDYAMAQNNAADVERVERDRLMNDLDDERRREMELQSQLAELQAADAADAAAARQRPAQPAAAASGRQLPPTVLIFRDHHQQEVNGYAIHGNTLYTFDQHWSRRVPVSDLDVPATVKANQDRGLDFYVPAR